MAEDGSVGKMSRPPTASQLAAIRALPENAAAAWQSLHQTISAAEYVDPARYELEQATLFRRLPVAIAPSIWLAETGSFVCHDGFGQPIILTRDPNGKAHAFVNVCRHRGARLVRDEAAKSGRLIVCPYHAWSYDLTGRLAAVPQEQAFAQLDKSELGLASLPCEEKGGLIWVRLDRAAAADFSHVSAELVDDLDALGLDRMHLFAHRRHRVASNWKLIMDAFHEGYHVTRLHSDSLGAVSEDVSVGLDRVGHYLRQTSGRINFKRELVAERANSIDELRRIVVIVYTLAPNAMLICSTDFTNLLVMLPQSADETIVENFMLTHHAPQTDKERNRWELHRQRTDDRAFPEDFSAAAACHEGLKTGVNKSVILGGMELGVKLYHDLLKELIEA